MGHSWTSVGVLGPPQSPPGDIATQTLSQLWTNHFFRSGLVFGLPSLVRGAGTMGSDQWKAGSSPDTGPLVRHMHSIQDQSDQSDISTCTRETTVSGLRLLPAQG